MPEPTATLDLIATSAFGLEAVVARELQRLGHDPKIIQPGRILFRGSEADICRANLWLRAADRVLVRLGCYEARDFGQLFDGARALPWEDWLPADAEFPVSGRSVKSQLSSVPACQKIVKKAVVERLKAAYGDCPDFRGHRAQHGRENGTVPFDAGKWLPETGPKYSLEVALLDNLATLTIDTSGPGLHKRGYRPLTGNAPLKETMAAAMVMLSVWRPDRPMIDPFCGSGTIPIEAALIGRNLAPGLGRSFLAESWPRLPAALWDAARQAARAAALPELPSRIIGTDVDEGVLGLARFHAEKAGVAADIHFQQRSFSDLSSKRPYGCVICNPPYGERLGESAEAHALHRAMPDVFRRLKTWSFFILTALPDFEAVIGQSATRRRKLYNGRIECTYYQFLGPKPGRREKSECRMSNVETIPNIEIQMAETVSDIEHSSFEFDSTFDIRHSSIEQPSSSTPHPRPVFGGLSAKAHEQAEIFRARLTKRVRHLRRWPKQGITCYRLYEQDIPEVPLVVDRYEDCLHIAEFARPTEHTPAEHADWLDLMLRTAAEATEVPVENVFLKRRVRQRGAAQYERLDAPSRTITVHEGGLLFEVNLSNYLDTGLFLDHRITRGMVREAAGGTVPVFAQGTVPVFVPTKTGLSPSSDSSRNERAKTGLSPSRHTRFINLFAYTGSFSVYAAAGGAAETVTVDLSNTYLDWARRNMTLNGFTGLNHEFVRDDAMRFLESRRGRDLFDLAVVDAPTFSNSKALEDYWDIQQNHAALLNCLAELMSPGGVIFFSTNFRRFKLAETELAALSIREISRQTVPPDFRNRRIHRCWRMVK